MCQLCSTCTTMCPCPRCPFRKGRLMGFPPEIQPCTICGMEDDRNCNQEECTIMEHCLFSGDMYCQICVEQEHGVTFWSNAIGMYCEEHEDAHKERMRSKRSSRLAQVQAEQAEQVEEEEEQEEEEERVSERIRVELPIVPEPEGGFTHCSIYR